MKKFLLALTLVLLCSFSVKAQLGGLKVNKNSINAVKKGVQALTLTDAEIAAYYKEYVDWSDKNNPVCNTTDKDKGKKAVADRLEKIVSSIPDDVTKGLTLNIKAYYVVDVNAFAAADGSIRVFSGLMERMSDDEILAVIGHEIGHVSNKDSKDRFKTALMTSALKDAVASTSGTAAALSDSQLGALGEALANAQYSQKQENQADDYGYEFMKKCGKDPKAMASALGQLVKMKEELGVGKSSKTNQLFSSHPDLEKRIERLNKKK